jgi:hypothetical protein
MTHPQQAGGERTDELVGDDDQRRRAGTEGKVVAMPPRG